MEKRKIVCSLKWSIALKNIGVKQESLFWWNPPLAILKDGKEEVIPDVEWLLSDQNSLNKNIESYAAFTLSELGEMLPKGTWLNTFFHSLEIQVQEKDLKYVGQAETEVDARAKMLIYLLENKSIFSPTP